MRTSHLLLAFAGLVQSLKCSRPALAKALDDYFASTSERSIQVKLSPTIKISSNGYLYPSLNQTSWANTTGVGKPDFKVQAIDTSACQAARYTVVNQKNETGVFPALVSLRLALEDNDGPLSEVEILNIIQGDHILFQPKKFEDSTPALFNSSQAYVGKVSVGDKDSNATKQLSRNEIIKVANTYLEGVEKGDNTKVIAGPSCPRVSNGEKTSNHCDQGLQQFKWPVDNRRWIADEETGVAFGAFIFRGALLVNNQTGDYINEYLSVKDGQIREIRAAMIYSKRDIKAVWPEDRERPRP